MRLPTLSLLVVALVACSGESAPVDSGTEKTTKPGPVPYTPVDDCGEITYHDLSFRGLVLGVGGQPQAGATVELRDFTFTPPRVLGSATSAGGGTFSFDVTRLQSIEDCWANGRLDYRIVATLDATSAEERINNPIFNAIFRDKDFDVDLSAIPLELE